MNLHRSTSISVPALSGWQSRLLRQGPHVLLTTDAVSLPIQSPLLTSEAILSPVSHLYLTCISAASLTVLRLEWTRLKPRH